MKMPKEYQWGTMKKQDKDLRKQQPLMDPSTPQDDKANPTGILI